MTKKHEKPIEGREWNMETYRTVSLVLWWLFVVACVFGILQLFKLLAKKLQQKYLRYVGAVAAVFFSITMSKPMFKLQIQIMGMHEAAEAYRSNISESMDSRLIEEIQNHNSKVEELQSKVNEHPVIYWFMCGDFGHYEDFLIRLPE